MKIAVSSTGQTLESQVDPRFGRAAFFLLVDIENGTLDVHDNAQNLNAAQGAGIQAAETICRMGADVVITGHCGPKAFRALQAGDVQVVVGAETNVAEAIEQFQGGQLVPADVADVDGHWA
jgi:predicted Fe-Mo cluster-binding NifX family protein